MSATENRAEFGSKLDFILSAAGSAVGLANIWKFSDNAYACGGGVFFTTLFVGWIWDPDNSIEEATSYGKYKFTLAPAYKFIVKYFDPVAIGAIIIAGMIFGMNIS